VSSGVKEEAPRVGGMMRIAQQWVMDQIYAQVCAKGYDDLGQFHIGMFRANIPDGLRPTEVAKRLGITKQSVNQIVRDLEERGYLRLVPDPTDGRARVIRLTAKGQRLHDVAYELAVAAEEAMARLLGPRRFTEFRTALAEINEHIAAGDMQFPDAAASNRAATLRSKGGVTGGSRQHR
jgi:DNA-binding MarR family transcriptional regulator